MEKVVLLTEDELAMWLHKAKAAHALHEAKYGPDADWPEWYAGWIARNIGIEKDTLEVIGGERFL